jgi:hypothetical protein
VNAAATRAGPGARIGHHSSEGAGSACRDGGCAFAVYFTVIELADLPGGGVANSAARYASSSPSYAWN